LIRTAAILPVKRFVRAKQRLGVTVPDPLRVDLARAMVGDVLSALRDCPSIALRIVVTDERSVAAAAHYQGAIVVADGEEDGQSAAVARGLRRALTEGAQRALCVPGDCPALDPHELDALLSADSDDPRAASSHDSQAAGSSSPEVVIVPDRHGTGTNGLLLCPPDAIDPSFGPNSCERHRELALAAGVPYRIERPPSLTLDIDTGEDLAALRARLAGEHTRAPRTRVVLGLAKEPCPAFTSAA
jgi:2-phospho-L-lactate guanylyltransferase